MSKARAKDKPGEKAEPRPARQAAVASAPLEEARRLLARGDLRAARQLLRSAAQSGPEADRAAARALLESTGVDRVALLVAGAVLLVIVLATWAAILHR